QNNTGPRKQNTTLEQYIVMAVFLEENLPKKKKILLSSKSSVKKCDKSIPLQTEINFLSPVNLIDSGILSTDAYCSRKTFCWRVACLREAKLPCLLPESGVLVDYLPKRGRHIVIWLR
ncbi:hypothetical protein CEXT_756821, partial [Caerostris extrusa]